VPGPIHHHTIDDDLRENRQHHLEPADDAASASALSMSGTCGRKKGHSHPSPRPSSPVPVRTPPCSRTAPHTRPVLEQLGARDLHVAERGVDEPACVSLTPSERPSGCLPSE